LIGYNKLSVLKRKIMAEKITLSEKKEEKQSVNLDFVFEAKIIAPDFQDIMPIGGSCYITCLDINGQELNSPTVVHEAVQFNLPPKTYYIKLLHTTNDSFHLVKYEAPMPKKDIPTEPQYSGVAEEKISQACLSGNHTGMRLRTGRYLQNGQFFACCTHCLEQRLIVPETQEHEIERKRVYCY